MFSTMFTKFQKLLSRQAEHTPNAEHSRNDSCVKEWKELVNIYVEGDAFKKIIAFINRLWNKIVQKIDGCQGGNNRYIAKQRSMQRP